MRSDPSRDVPCGTRVVRRGSPRSASSRSWRRSRSKSSPEWNARPSSSMTSRSPTSRSTRRTPARPPEFAPDTCRGRTAGARSSRARSRCRAKPVERPVSPRWHEAAHRLRRLHRHRTPVQRRLEGDHRGHGTQRSGTSRRGSAPGRRAQGGRRRTVLDPTVTIVHAYTVRRRGRARQVASEGDRSRDGSAGTRTWRSGSSSSHRFGRRAAEAAVSAPPTRTARTTSAGASGTAYQPRRTRMICPARAPAPAVDRRVLPA